MICYRNLKPLLLILLLVCMNMLVVAQRNKESFQGIIRYEVSVHNMDDHNIHNYIFVEDYTPNSMQMRFGPEGALRIDYQGSGTGSYEYEIVLPKEKKHYKKYFGNDTLFYSVFGEGVDVFNTSQRVTGVMVLGRKCKAVELSKVKEGITGESATVYYDPSLFLDPEPYKQDGSLFLYSVFSRCRAPWLEMVEHVTTFACDVHYTAYEIDATVQDGEWFTPDAGRPVKHK